MFKVCVVFCVIFTALDMESRRNFLVCELGCQNVGGHAFSRDVLGIHQLPSMVSVNLSHCSSIGDESIMALCELCPNLTELNLTGSTRYF